MPNHEASNGRLPGEPTLLLLRLLGDTVMGRSLVLPSVMDAKPGGSAAWRDFAPLPAPASLYSNGVQLRMEISLGFHL